MKKLLLVVILLAIAYVGGYWPEHQHVQQTERQLADVHEQLVQAQDAVRISHMENELLTIIDQAQAQNYGDAQKTNSQFFDDLNAETNAAPNAPYIGALKGILARRDAVVSGLARTDAGTINILRQSLNELRQIAQQANALVVH